MPNLKSAVKRAAIEEKRRTRNHAVKTKARTLVAKARAAIHSAPEAEMTAEAIRLAMRQLDHSVSLGVLHRNNAARRKSRLAKRLKKALNEQQ